MADSPKYKFIRQFISPFITGTNARALINTIADEAVQLENLSVSVNDQLSISTSSGVYLDKRLAELDITRPPDLGMDDDAFREMGITINAQKQVTEVIHTILNVFYGEDTVRGWCQSFKAEPYDLSAVTNKTMDLQFELESGDILTFNAQASDFRNPSQATAQELADALTRFIRNSGINGFARAYRDVDSNQTTVRIYGGAMGPYSQVRIWGGRLQTILQFPELRPTDLGYDNIMTTTQWEITKNIGSTIRMRWVGGSAPALDKLFPGDRILVYGAGFESANPTLIGSFDVTDIRPSKPSPSYDAGWVEFTNDAITDLKSSTPDVAPPVNGGGNVFSYTVIQGFYPDVQFHFPQKFTPYSQSRYALAWEPADQLLRVYIPATTKVVRRGLKGSTHLHMLYGADDLNGAYGSLTDKDLKIQVVSDYSFRYPQSGSDNIGQGGSAIINLVSHEIDYVSRENGYTTVTLKVPHNLVPGWSMIDSYQAGDVVKAANGNVQDTWYALQANTGQTPQTSPAYWTLEHPDNVIRSNRTASITLAQVVVDDVSNKFPGSYMWDETVNYTLTDTFVTSRESISQGEPKRTLFCKGIMPNEYGILLFDLNKDSQEGPVKYFASQVANAPTTSAIVSISQNGTTVTVTTAGPHGAIPGSTVVITGTTSFNGAYIVDTVNNATIYKFTKTPAAVVFESVGQSATQLDGAACTLIVDPSYRFKFDHDIGADITLISDDKAHTPKIDGTDYPTYITGTSDGRVFCNDIIEAITALGIKLEIIVLYPSDVGLGNAGGSVDENDPPVSDKTYVWGE